MSGEQGIPSYEEGTLHPLELSYWLWSSISMGFITNLPMFGGCCTVWVVFNRFTTIAHFIPIKDKQETTEGCVNLFGPFRVVNLFGPFRVRKLVDKSGLSAEPKRWHV